MRLSIISRSLAPKMLWSTLFFQMTLGSVILAAMAQPASSGIYNVENYPNNIQGAFTAAAQTCGIVYFPASKTPYTISSTIFWPPCVSIRGDGWGSQIQVSKGITGIQSLAVHPSATPYQGFIEEISFIGNGTQALLIQNRSQVEIRHVLVDGSNPGGFTQAGIRLEGVFLVSMYDCLIENTASGGTHGALEVDWYAPSGATAPLPSTTFQWLNNYVSGNAGALAGVMLDHLSSFSLIGGSIESSGVPLKMASLPVVDPRFYKDGYPTKTGTVLDVDLEMGRNNPADHYIDCGLNGAQVGAVPGTSVVPPFPCQSIHFAGISMFPSGSTTAISQGIELYNSYAISAGANTVALSSSSSPGSIYSLYGNNLALGSDLNGNFTMFGPVNQSGASALVSLTNSSGTVLDSTPLTAAHYVQGQRTSAPAISWGAIPANSCVVNQSSADATVPAANPGMTCSATPATDPGSQFTWSCLIPSAAKVQIRICNASTTPATPAAVKWTVSAQ